MRRLPLSALFLGSIVVLAQEPSSRQSRWREDIRVFADEFSRHQLDFAKLYPDRVFKGEVTTLSAAAGKLSDIEITMRLMRQVASANVGHNSFRLPSNQLGFDRLPILMRCTKNLPGTVSLLWRRRHPMLRLLEPASHASVL